MKRVTLMPEKTHPQRWKKTASNPLGTGGNANVFQVTEEGGNGQPYALKELVNLKAVDRFAKEVSNLKSLQGHPNIVPLIDSYLPDTVSKKNRPFIVMPLAAETLQARIDSGKYYNNTQEALPAFLTLCRAVSHLHANGKSHRDLKPANILFNPGGTLWLADLGLALDIETCEADRLTSTKEQIGSRYYLAPELRNGRNLDADHRPADVYGLGKILYVMLAGTHLLFDRESYKEPGYNLINVHNDVKYRLVNALFDRMILESPQLRASIDSLIQDVTTVICSLDAPDPQPETASGAIALIAAQLERDAETAARRKASASRDTQVAYVSSIAALIQNSLQTNRDVAELSQKIQADFNVTVGQNDSVMEISNPGIFQHLSNLGYQPPMLDLHDYRPLCIALCITPLRHVLGRYPLLRLGFCVAPLKERPVVYAYLWKSNVVQGHWFDVCEPDLLRESFWKAEDEYGSLALKEQVRGKIRQLVPLILRELVKVTSKIS
jgi:serine/threonine protein kinase